MPDVDGLEATRLAGVLQDLEAAASDESSSCASLTEEVESESSGSSTSPSTACSGSATHLPA